MGNIVINPVEYNPGSVNIGKSYSQDTSNYYVTLPAVQVSADLVVPSKSFEVLYDATPYVGKAISYAMAVIASSTTSVQDGRHYLNIRFNTQVYFDDDTRDYNVIDASIEIKQPSDFNNFSIVGPFSPVICNTEGVIAEFFTEDSSKIKLTITINKFILPITGESEIRVQVATGSFS